MNPLFQMFGPKQPVNQAPSIPNPQTDPGGFLSSAIQEAKAIVNGQNPQLQQQYALNQLKQLGINIPENIQNDPNQITRYLINNVVLNDLQKQILDL